jgi:hypothetical protein
MATATASKGSVKLPGIGKVKRQHLYVAGAGIGGVVIYAWWRQGGGFAPTEPALVDDDLVPNTEPNLPTVVDSNVNYEAPPKPSTNDEWARMAAQEMEDAGWNKAAVQVALGKYLNRVKLTPAEIEIVTTAIGVMGRPPIGDYPILEFGPPTGGVAVGKVAGLRATKVTKNSVTLAWDPVANAKDYKVQRYGGGTAYRSSPSHTSTGLPPGSTQAFFVSARDASGTPGDATEIRVTLADAGGYQAPAGAPVAPSNVKVSASRTSVKLTWPRVPGATRYLVTRQGGGRGVPRRTGSHTSTGLRPNTMYTFVIRAENAKGAGPSTVVTARTRP